jgi:hypothetical protein
MSHASSSFSRFAFFHLQVTTVNFRARFADEWRASAAEGGARRDGGAREAEGAGDYGVY